MVMNLLSDTAMQELRVLLEQMDVCAQQLETIIQREQESIRALDAEQIVTLSDQRIQAHQALAQLEATCRALLDNQSVSRDMTLEVIIDTHAGSQASDLQALRRNLYARMIKVDQKSQENRLSMLAAYNVTSTILQQLGLVSSENTYSRNGAK